MRFYAEFSAAYLSLHLERYTKLSHVLQVTSNMFQEDVAKYQELQKTEEKKPKKPDRTDFQRRKNNNCLKSICSLHH